MVRTSAAGVMRDEMRQQRGSRVRRTLGVTAIWLVAAVPIALGVQRCPTAVFFHRPCPGCGMTRAMMFLWNGDLAASLAMHPLALPGLASNVLVAIATIHATYTLGSPLLIHRTRFGQVSLALLAFVFVSLVALWIARWSGHFGGPVPV